jgi:hypothetical protein
MGLSQGDIVLEMGHQADVDEEFRSSLEGFTGTKIISGHAQEVVDAVILWWRDGNGDLADELMDALTYLSESGAIWVLNPKVGRASHVEPSDIQDAATTAGLSQTSTLAVTKDWSATRLVARKASKR